MFPAAGSPMLSIRLFPQIPALFLTCWKALAQALNLSIFQFSCLVCRDAWEILALGVQDTLKVQSIIMFTLTTCLSVL